MVVSLWCRGEHGARILKQELTEIIPELKSKHRDKDTSKSLQYLHRYSSTVWKLLLVQGPLQLLAGLTSQANKMAFNSYHPSSSAQLILEYLTVL